MSRADSAQRAKILQAAVGVFASHGLGGAAIRLVGKAAGINSALIYYYFENKHSLFVESVRFVVRGLLDALGDKRHSFVNARERLAFLVDGVVDYYGRYPERMKLMIAAITLHPDLFGKVIESLVMEGIPLPLDILREGMERNQIKGMHPIQIWWCILGSCLFNLRLQGLIGQLNLPADLPLPDAGQARNHLIDMLCHGLAVEEEVEKRTEKDL